MKLKIGILYSKESKTLPYQQWAELLGGDVQLINSRSETINENIDLLILVGGADVYPDRYNQKPDIRTGQPNMDLEWWDKNILPEYVKLAQQKKLAIFGICRGFQTLNVAFGGKLTQDIPQGYSSQTRQELVDEVMLQLLPVNLSRFYYYKTGTTNKQVSFKANSLHHQGFYPQQIAKGFVETGINKDFKNIEAMVHETLPIAAVQYHPKIFGA